MTMTVNCGGTKESTKTVRDKARMVIACVFLCVFVCYALCCVLYCVVIVSAKLLHGVVRRMSDFQEWAVGGLQRENHGFL